VFIIYHKTKDICPTFINVKSA